MANPMDQEKEANPIAEIFDEVFTLLEDLETRNAAMLEYMKEQGGVTDEKLAPYLDRAAAASDVRWRAARARMEHLLAPKPKSATEVGKDEKTKEPSQSQPKEKGATGGAADTKPQGERNRTPKPIRRISEKNLRRRSLASRSRPNPRTGNHRTRSPLPKRAEQKKADDGQQEQRRSDARRTQIARCSSSPERKHPLRPSIDNAKNQKPQSEDGKSASQSRTEKQQTQKAANSFLN